MEHNRLVPGAVVGRVDDDGVPFGETAFEPFEFAE